ncbi:hypothetical protein CRE_09879 [Caenorhabditis remanei]|uniref:Splicing factor 45 n=1 Tax=Caenorhabditis remanei TaxID=31234 RepID=E3NLF2_CAERE|nr:hypothetical protein CRE_09879 [Caenorhabditis remanei]
MYNDDEDDVPMGPPAAKQAKPMLNTQMAFLQSQLAQKKAALQQKARQTVKSSAPPPPVIDLSARNRPLSSAVTPKPFQPIRANPVTENISFLPKAATDESVMIFGEEHIKCEYYPMVPNNFEVLAKEINDRKQREKTAREVAKRLQREHEEEDKKRSKGAAIAPPTMLIEPEPEVVKINDEVQEDKPQPSFKPPSFLPAFGKATSRGLGIAANIMKKHGYREGQGLGKSEQGMSTALQVEKVGVRAGNIVGETPKAPTFATNSMEAVQKCYEKVSNEDGKKEFADEIKERKWKKCGPKEEGRRVRVFVEFTKQCSSDKSICHDERKVLWRKICDSWIPSSRWIQ